MPLPHRLPCKWPIARRLVKRDLLKSPVEDKYKRKEPYLQTKMRVSRSRRQVQISQKQAKIGQNKSKIGQKDRSKFLCEKGLQKRRSKPKKKAIKGDLQKSHVKVPFKRASPKEPSKRALQNNPTKQPRKMGQNLWGPTKKEPYLWKGPFCGAFWAPFLWGPTKRAPFH